MKKILLASHNEGKIKEVKEILAPLGIELISANELNLPDVEETGTTFEENAILKAKAFAKSSGLYCIADDSGLCVNALNGAPGVYSARYAPNRDFNKGMDKLIADITATDSNDWSAYFQCVIALSSPTEDIKLFDGRIYGKISPTKLGDAGFGYDPIFIPDGYTTSFGEMDKAEKNNISHRGNALKKLQQHLKNNDKG